MDIGLIASHKIVTDGYICRCKKYGPISHGVPTKRMLWHVQDHKAITLPQVQPVHRFLEVIWLPGG